jgi:VCBS repeat-containing protein
MFLFNQEVQVPIGVTAIDVTLGDVIVDGNRDLVAAGGNEIAIMERIDPFFPAAGFQNTIDRAHAGAGLIRTIAWGMSGIPDDLVVTAGGTLTLLLSNGDGTFLDYPAMPTGASPWLPVGMEIADFNNDSLPDVAVANDGGDDAVAVFPGALGEGSIYMLQNFVGFGVGGSLRTGIAVGDLDGDWYDDVVTSNAGSNNVSVLLNNSTGPADTTPDFGTAVEYATGASPLAVAIGDVNNDGALDLAVADGSYTFPSVSVLLGAGDGSFGAPMTTDLGLWPRDVGFEDRRDVAIADLDLDGNADLVVSVSFSDIAVLAGNGDGTFDAPQLLDENFVNGRISLGDVNGDGRSDIIAATLGNSVLVYQQDVLAPVLDLNGEGTGQDFTAPFSAGGPAVPITTDAEIQDDDSFRMTGATVVLTNAKTGDSLTLAGGFEGINGEVDSSVPGQITLTLTSSGLATASNYEEVLNLVVFDNSEASPDTTDRDITVTIHANDRSSNTAHSIITLGGGNDPPVLTDVAEDVVYNLVPTLLDGSVTITDDDDTHLESATLAITDFVFGDVLAVGSLTSPTNDISWSYDGLGQLLFTGHGLKEDYEALLKQVRFNAFDVFDGDRTVTWTINDGDDDNVAPPQTVISTNVPPVLLNAASQTYTEHDAPKILSPNILAVDPNVAPWNSATVTIGGFYVSGDVLDADTDGTNIIAVWDEPTRTLTLTGPDPVASFQQVLRKVTFEHVGDDPTNGGAFTSRMITWRATDNFDAVTIMPAFSNVFVTATDDGPQNVVPPPQTVNEDTNLVFGGAGAISVEDPDGGTSDVTVTLSVDDGVLTLGSVPGGLSFSDGDGSQDETMTFSGTLGDVNAALNGLTYRGDLNFNGDDTLTITTTAEAVEDNHALLMALEAGDVDTVEITVAPVNDAPAVSAGTQSNAIVEAGAAGPGTPAATVTLTKSDLDGTATYDAAALLAGGWAALPGGLFSRAGARGTATLNTATDQVSYLLDQALADPLNAGGSAVESFTVAVTDGDLTASANAQFTVNGANDGPTAIADTAEAEEGGGIGGNVILGVPGADQDPDSLSLTVTGIRRTGGAVGSVGAGLASGYGTLTLNANGSFGYTADGPLAVTLNGGHTFEDSFTYTVSDGSVSSEATLVVTVVGKNPGADGSDTFAGNDGPGGPSGTSDFGITSGGPGNDVLLGTPNVDHLDGGTGNDTILGNAGNDTMFGRAGDDTLIGEGGIDSMTGGAGSDDYYIQQPGDAAIEQAGGGLFDRALVFVDNHVLAANVEIAAVIGGAGRTAFGNDEANILFGNSGNDQLVGGGGSDQFAGGEGNDTIDGGAGADAMGGGLGDDDYIVDNLSDAIYEFAGQGTDRALVTVGGYTLPVHVEIGAVVTLAGARLDGNAAANVLFGWEGNDQLLGGGGSDQFNGGGGNDYIDGGAGADGMGGSFGNDDFIVGDLGDTIHEFAGQGIDRALVTVNHTLAANVEIGAIITGASGIVLTGNAASNTLFGNSGDDTLVGGGGNDAFSAGAGSDRVAGGDGNDALTGGADADTFVFDSALDAATNVDLISDFAGDTIELHQTIFGSLAGGTLAVDQFHVGTAAADSDDFIIYDGTTGRLYYDADGDGGGAQILFARVALGTALSNADFQVIGFGGGP